METFPVLNGYENVASTDDQEWVMLALAAGCLGRAEFTELLRANLDERQTARPLGFGGGIGVVPFSPG